MANQANAGQAAGQAPSSSSQKFSDPALRGKYSTKLKDDFGNWHFGIVANGFGWNLEQSMFGAGANQVVNQGGGSPLGLAAGAAYLGSTALGYTGPNAVAEFLTRNGMTWGDNPGDAENILEGWKDADTAF